MRIEGFSNAHKNHADKNKDVVNESQNSFKRSH